MTDQFFMLFASCIPVKGAQTSIIMDLDRGSYLEVPGLLCDVLSVDLQTHSIEAICAHFDHQYDEGIKGYFDFLVKEEYGFYTSNPASFRKPVDVFRSPYKVISSVIALDRTSTYPLSTIIKQLDALSCQMIQLRIYDAIDLDWLFYELAPLKQSSVKMLEIYLPQEAVKSEEVLKRFYDEYPNVLLIIHGADAQRQLVVSEESIRKIVFTPDTVTRNTREVYDKSLFVISHNMYYEARHFNTGLHRKVCVDTDGGIKNYLSHEKVYGNISKDKIEEIIARQDFQEKYHITNDQVEKCKECPYRYMCLSNSDVVLEDGKYYKVQGCDEALEAISVAHQPA